eukprot:1901080-Alexandrium_andersonii.AAC.1
MPRPVGSVAKNHLLLGNGRQTDESRRQDRSVGGGTGGGPRARCPIALRGGGGPHARHPAGHRGPKPQGRLDGQAARWGHGPGILNQQLDVDVRPKTLEGQADGRDGPKQH